MPNPCRAQRIARAPVARYWPEFAAAGKQDIPVRYLLSHEVGLPVLDKPLAIEDFYAWEPPVKALAAQSPVWEPGTTHGYHAITYGWLVGEVVRRISGKSLGTFFADEVAGPLGLDFWIGLPASEESRVSRIIEVDLEDPHRAIGGAAGDARGGHSPNSYSPRNRPRRRST